HRQDWPRQRRESRETATLHRQPASRYPVDGAARHDYPRAAQTIVLGNDKEVELATPDARILNLRRQGAPAARPADRQGRHRCVAAATDDEVWPGRRERRFSRGQREKPEPGRQAGPRETSMEPSFDKRE